MASSLRKVPSSDAALGAYEIRGPLDGVVPGRRTVKQLDVRGADGAEGAGLRPLTEFRDLRDLRLEGVRHLDLEVIGDLKGLRSLHVENAAGLDLSTLRLPPGLARLVLLDLDADCVVPSRLPLPSTMESLVLGERRASQTGALVAALVKAIDWTKLAELRALAIRVGGLDAVAPAQADLGFLRDLPGLKDLMLYGVEHDGPGPSPLRPPFEGLPRDGVKRLIFDAPTAERDAIRAAAHAAFDFEHVGVTPRDPFVAPPPPWQIKAADDGGFSVYGSLAETFNLPSEATESDGLRELRRRMREVDPELLRRLDFDGEAGGTGIAARSREDLQRALEIAGLTPAA